jgi:hypothetical protein
MGAVALCLTLAPEYLALRHLLRRSIAINVTSLVGEAVAYVEAHRRPGELIGGGLASDVPLVIFRSCLAVQRRR